MYSDGDDQNKHVLNILDDYSIKHHGQDNSFDSGESEFPKLEVFEVKYRSTFGRLSGGGATP